MARGPLAGVRFVSGDFEDVVSQARSGDFLYIDPPYTVSHNNNGFIKYNQTLFSWDDQIRLARVVCEAAGRGAKVLVSNADHASLRALYSELPYHHTLYRESILSANPSGRRQTSEVAFSNYVAPMVVA